MECDLCSRPACGQNDHQNLGQLSLFFFFFFFGRVEEVTKLFLSVFIDINKVSHGSDNIALRILKECNEDLAGPLATLFNFCFSQGKIPAEW